MATPDPFLTFLCTFKASEYGRLAQLVQQIEARPERDECLRLLADRLLEVYGADKKRIKSIREKFSSLAPYLVTR